jgi:predicted RNA-binding Zn-ribbon protein involved in translation (DUF1610 family)
MEEQGIACLSCGNSERIREDSPRLSEGQWPAWDPGPQEFPCPDCGASMVWATKPRPVLSEVEGPVTPYRRSDVPNKE